MASLAVSAEQLMPASIASKEPTRPGPVVRHLKNRDWATLCCWFPCLHQAEAVLTAAAAAAAALAPPAAGAISVNMK
jgi:hypothetical protein